MGSGFVGAYASSFQVFDYHTQNSGTAIDEEVQAQDGQRLALVTVNYLAGATAQDMNVMYAEGTGSRNVNGAAVAVSAQKDIILAVAGKDPAGNAATTSDIIAFQLTDNSWEFDTIASYDTLTITCTNNITGVDAGGGATAIAAGAKVMIFGVVGDGKLFKVHLAASTLLEKENTLLAWHPYVGEPFYVSNPNASNASFQNNLIFAHIGNK